ncbi:MAG: DEAD/DEAH box helicase [Candidatus Aenigmarchaeota archaeon]|nr:DEAD/DEAH box helicase [Candidatus Aenigmarchaeota archaeon]
MVAIRDMEERAYQTRLAQVAERKNTLVCLPTGMGKTNIAVMVAAARLEHYPGSQVLVLAPTKPLAAQHARTFQKFLDLGAERFQVVTGEIPPEDRAGFYSRTLIFATPQTVQKDLAAERWNLRNVSLLVIDELHHAVGRYAYPFIAQRFLEEAPHARILGLTASPGSSREKIAGICRNTGIEAVEIATEDDQDVRPYVQEKDIDWIEVELPERFRRIKVLLEDAYATRTRRLGVKTRRELLWLQKKLQQTIRTGNRSAFGLSSLVAQAMKIEHALGLLETQTIPVLCRYFQKLEEDPSRAAAALAKDASFSRAVALTAELFQEGSRHPKMGRLCALVAASMPSRVIVFANYRDTVREIAEVLASVKGCLPAVLVGQREGLTQKEQIEIIRRYEIGEVNCLVTTSIGEEGLDIEAADLAVFYETVPSEIRLIQRRGRVGRTRVGKVSILVAKGTRDEAYRWASLHREQKMKRTLQGMKSPQKTLT